MVKPARGKKAALRHLLNLIKPAPTLGKRRRDDSEEDHATDAPPPHRAPSPPPAPCVPPACIALQNEDTAEDAIVITALTTVPFCCHADLVTMNRAALLTVASVLNDKLPYAMQIDISATRPDASIRHSIELLVGIRSAMPPPPRHRRSRSVFETSQLIPPSPASPLAGRSRPNVVLGTPGLSTLREESSRESDERSSKRRRTAAPPNTPTADPRRPITRSRSHAVAPVVAANVDAGSATVNTRVLRARSQMLPERAPLYPSIHANAAVTVTRGRGRGAHVAKRDSFAMTSTPKKRRLAAVNSPAAVAPRYKPILVDFGAGDASPANYLHPGKAEESMQPEEVTFGIDGLTMPLVDPDCSDCSDMDISTGSG